MSDKEVFIENKFVKYVNDDGGETIKLIKKKGWPDRIVLPPVPMGILWIEFKRPKFSAKKIQEHVHKKLKELGHVIAVCHSYEQAVEIYEEYKRLCSSRVPAGSDKVSSFQTGSRSVPGSRTGKDYDHVDGILVFKEEEDS